MHLLFYLLITTVTAIEFDLTKFSVVEIGNATIHIPKINSSKIKKLAINNPSLKVMRHAVFLEEIEECKSQYPDKNSSQFYKNLYCSLIDDRYTTAEGSPCNMTEALATNLKDTLLDFSVFKNSLKEPVHCDMNPKKRSLGPDPDNDIEINIEGLKMPDSNCIYLGASRYPITTLTNRILFNRNVRSSTESIPEREELKLGDGSESY